jgi:hypothetical protein
VIRENDQPSCAILFEAGMDPILAMHYAIKHGNDPFYSHWLMSEYRVDPFIIQNEQYLPVSPFVKAAQEKTSLPFWITFWTSGIIILSRIDTRTKMVIRLTRCS